MYRSRAANGGVKQRASDGPPRRLLLVPRRRSRVAVCILRVEVEPARMIITMTVNRDIATTTTQPVTRFTDTGEATAAVAEFLESFTRDKPP